MAKKTNRREFVQVAGLAASGFMATAGLAGAVPDPQARPAPQAPSAAASLDRTWLCSRPPSKIVWAIPANRRPLMRLNTLPIAPPPESRLPPIESAG